MRPARGSSRRRARLSARPARALRRATLAGPADFRSSGASRGTPAPARGKLYRFDDLGIRRTATEIAGEVVPDLFVARIGFLVEELAGHKHEAGRAEAALESAALD